MSLESLGRNAVGITPAGSFFDGTRVGLALNPAWNQSKYLELQGGYEVNRLEFAERGLSTTG